MVSRLTRVEDLVDGFLDKDHGEKVFLGWLLAAHEVPELRLRSGREWAMTSEIGSLQIKFTIVAVAPMILSLDVESMNSCSLSCVK